MRPWEYFKELTGRAGRASVLQRLGRGSWAAIKEFAGYYHRVIEPAGEVPIIFCGPSEVEEKASRTDWLGKDPQRDESSFATGAFSGTVIVDARFLGRKPFWDIAALRTAAPTARFGNLMIFRGTFAYGSILAGSLYEQGLTEIFGEKPD